MSIEEIKSFITEMNAVRKMACHLPLDLLETHFQEIVDEIKAINELSFIEEEKIDLIGQLNSLKNNLEKEIHNR